MKEVKEELNVLDMKLGVVENKVSIINRKLDITTDQVARNIEFIEEVKLKLQ